MEDDNPIPPLNLKLKESGDSQFVTEELGSMSPLFHRLLAAWNIAAGVAAIIIALNIWPSESKQNKDSENPVKDTANTSSIVVDSTIQNAKFGTALNSDEAEEMIEKEVEMEMDPGIRLIILSLLFGVLGGATHGLSSIMNFRGQRRLFRSWSLWYFGRPLLGGMVALTFYLVVRAGLFSGSSGGDAVNLYGIVAVSTLVGMFTDQALNKLSELFKIMFATKGSEREGKLTSDKPGHAQ